MADRVKHSWPWYVFVWPFELIEQAEKELKRTLPALYRLLCVCLVVYVLWRWLLS